VLLDPGLFELHRGMAAFNDTAEELLKEARLLQSLRSSYWTAFSPTMRRDASSASPTPRC
jgi:hypothetical protein